jgi:hypothetical protein
MCLIKKGWEGSMGQVGSTGEFTQEGIKEIKDVKETDVMMNLIFRYMSKKIMVIDLMKLSEPDTCSQYVVSLAQHMSTQFSRLQILPYKENKSDVLLFKRYSELDPSKTSEGHSKSEKESLCLLLSYYYVRIFQIYGALALTLLNDVSLSEATLTASKDDPRLVNKTPGYGKTRVANIQQFGGALGGADTVDTPGKLRDTIFKFLNPEDKTSYLVGEYSEKNGWKTKYDASSQATGGRAYFKITGTRINTTGGVETTTMLGEFYLYAPATQDRYLTLFVEATPAKGMNYDVTLHYTKLKSSDTTLVALPSSLKNADVSIRSGDGMTYTVHITEKSTTTTKQIPAYFQEVFYDLISEFSLKVKKPTSDGEINEEGTPEQFKLKTTIGALQDRRTTGHCIARALQLLRTIPSTVRGGPPSYQSDICMEKFSFTKRSYKGEVSSVPSSTRGIPTYGSSLAAAGADTRGFRSLVQLFYDTIRVGSPQIIISDQAFTEYTNFMKTMAHLFKDTAPTTTKEIKMEKGLIEIKNMRDKEMCKDLKSEGNTMPVDPRVNINAVSAVVKELYQIQVKHAKKCGEIFKLLFDIAYDEKKNPLTISLSKNVLQGGFEEINRINGLARKVLIDYYSDCEHKYVQGVDLIVAPIRDDRKAAASGASGAPLAGPLYRSHSAPVSAPVTAPVGPATASRPATGAPPTGARPGAPTGPPGPATGARPTGVAAAPGARPTAPAAASKKGGSFTAKAGRKIAYTRKNHVIRQ